MQFAILKQRLHQSSIIKPISSFFFFSKSTISTISTHSISSPIPKSILNFNSFNSIPSTHFINLRKFSGGESEPGLDHSIEIDEINLKFAEAREEIESAMESKETVYFDEEAECARAAVKEVLDLFNGLLGKLPESEKGVVQRAMGLKIEQLKAELAQLDE
ncbi:Polyribonucleotide nucleotidyltransferase [Thalictrum thalictroides]|uniref:Polyribonucleotide nucleotidyltransferase n=1 Tax=Thalictrum thalictroides TaxID=46969 RepID=A0A7J6V1V7_THATH|nr:Polyribonucleotide nucleotidyltransferase [Thalictrum thalictroides]